MKTESLFSSSSSPSTPAIEIAYRIPGTAWKLRTFKTQAALEKFFAKLDGDVEVRSAR
jgi:hypothetical protein